jgi:hypothetical protein
MNTITQVTIPNAIASRNAVFITDHGSTRASRSRAFRVRRAVRPDVRVLGVDLLAGWAFPYAGVRCDAGVDNADGGEAVRERPIVSAEADDGAPVGRPDGPTEGEPGEPCGIEGEPGRAVGEIPSAGDWAARSWAAYCSSVRRCAASCSAALASRWRALFSDACVAASFIAVVVSRIAWRAADNPFESCSPADGVADSGARGGMIGGVTPGGYVDPGRPVGPGRSEAPGRSENGGRDGYWGRDGFGICWPENCGRPSEGRLSEARPSEGRLSEADCRGGGLGSNDGPFDSRSERPDGGAGWGDGVRFDEPFEDEGAPLVAWRVESEACRSEVTGGSVAPFGRARLLIRCPPGLRRQYRRKLRR